MDKEFTFTVELYGIKTDGSNDIVYLQADSLIEAEIIVESFHDSYKIIECHCNISGNLVDWL